MLAMWAALWHFDRPFDHATLRRPRRRRWCGRRRRRVGRVIRAPFVFDTSPPLEEPIGPDLMQLTRCGLRLRWSERLDTLLHQSCRVALVPPLGATVHWQRLRMLVVKFDDALHSRQLLQPGAALSFRRPRDFSECRGTACRAGALRQRLSTGVR